MWAPKIVFDAPFIQFSRNGIRDTDNSMSFLRKPVICDWLLSLRFILDCSPLPPGPSGCRRGMWLYRRTRIARGELNSISYSLLTS